MTNRFKSPAHAMDRARVSTWKKVGFRERRNGFRMSEEKRGNFSEMGVSKNRGKSPKMDGENSVKIMETPIKWMILRYPYFWKRPD